MLPLRALDMGANCVADAQCLMSLFDSLCAGPLALDPAHAGPHSFELFQVRACRGPWLSAVQVVVVVTRAIVRVHSCFFYSLTSTRTRCGSQRTRSWTPSVHPPRSCAVLDPASASRSTCCTSG
jgi:hypothetical protein